MFIRSILILAALACAAPAVAQTPAPTITVPTPKNQRGDSVELQKSLIINPDGTIATIGTPLQAGSTVNVTQRGGSSIVTGQVSVGTTATLIAAARTGRRNIGVTVTAAVQCAFGNAGVTLTTGWPLAAVAYVSDNWDTAAALYGVCATAATTVGYRELNP